MYLTQKLSIGKTHFSWICEK
jgi:hypothetical protein